jgi:hypothetical protein
MTYDQIFSQTINDSKKSYTDLENSEEDALTFSIQDFKKYESGSIEDRETYYAMSKRGTRDAIARRGVFTYYDNAWETSNTTNTLDRSFSNIDEKDMIKFGFECISNDNPVSGLFLQFRAYLTNGITDNNQAIYQNFKYLGRGEDFFIYQGFTRTIGFSFRMAVENRQDLVPLYDKLNALVSQTYPDYSENGVMRTSLTRVTVGDYIYRMPGFLESVNVTVNQDSSWEIQNNYQMPHYVDVAVTFRPIHEEIPKKVKSPSDKRLILYTNASGTGTPSLPS